MIIQLPVTDKPMCPRVYGPVLDPAHSMANQTHDRMYAAAESARDNESGEYSDLLLGKVMDLAQGPGDLMDLYQERVGTHRGGQVLVVAYFFMCPTCGFVLPATAVERY